MPKATRREQDILRPFLEGEPNEKGEWGMHCLFHQDGNRSASVNFELGKWFCHACQDGGDIEILTDQILHGGGALVDPGPSGGSRGKFNGASSNGKVMPLPSEGTIAGWHSALLGKQDELTELVTRRGVSIETIERFQLGFAQDQRAYTIPIRDNKGDLVNVRFYQIEVAADRRKIWGVMGHNHPVLFPIHVLDDASEVVVCEGEWDAMITIQNGFPAVTRTGAAKVWKPTFNHHFDDKVVYVCHDMDEPGQAGNRLVMRELKGHAREMYEVHLPYPVTPDKGKDLVDFFHKDDHTAHDFKEILNNLTDGYIRPPEVVEKEYKELGVLDSFDAKQAGQKIRMRVTITGKRTPPFLIPLKAAYSCSQSKGNVCNICPMNELDGAAVRFLEGHDPLILEMMGATNPQVQDTMRRYMGVPTKCELLDIDIEEYRSVEELYVRPSVEQEHAAEGQAGDYTARKIVSVGRHDTLPNNTVEIVGSIFPNPKTQHNEFQAWEVARTETSIDRYEVTQEGRDLCEIFRPAPGQSPLFKLAEISKDLSANVTKIYGRNEMHAMFDLVWHSVISFTFNGQLLNRGWLECLVVGDTRTGKSEVAQRLSQHFGAGEMLSCESASYAGIVGGLQQIGSRGEWEITWGSVPLNDRRLVVLDEISGLTPDQIAQMSSIRSSGEAQLTKIRSERTWARTRLVWLGNPRNGRMSDYTFGVQAIAPLVGNAEDIARFDLAMSVAAGDVEAEEINRTHEGGTLVYTSDHCRELLRWAWSRRADHVVWADGAEAAVFASALDLGERYVEHPPLVQSANVRTKVARIAVALAARTYSTDATGELVVVTKHHVRDAVKFIDKIYGMEGFGYKQWSEEKIRDLRDAAKHVDDTKAYLAGQPGLAKFLRSMGSFRRTDLEDMLNMSKEDANRTISTLWTYRMIMRQGPQIKLVPIMHDILRSVRD